jgi:hypothetical protein
MLCFSALLLCAACQHTAKVKFPVTEQVTVHLLDSSMMMGSPMDMARYQDFLLISDYQGDSLIWVYDMNKRRCVQRLAPVGEGPHHFTSPLQMIVDDSRLILHNRWRFTYQPYEMSVRADTIHLQPIGSLVRMWPTVDRLCAIKDNRLVAVGPTEERYQILNDQGQVIDSIGEYPSFIRGESGLPATARYIAHQTSMTYNRRDNLLASISPHVLEIIDCNGDRPVVKKTILLSMYGYSPDISETGTSVNSEVGTESGAVRISSTDEYIYLVYDPNLIGGEPSLKLEIWVFDWEGNPVKKIQTDRDTPCIYVADDNRTVYCTVKALDPVLATFSLF